MKRPPSKLSHLPFFCLKCMSCVCYCKIFRCLGRRERGVLFSVYLSKCVILTYCTNITQAIKFDFLSGFTKYLWKKMINLVTKLSTA